MSKYMKTKLTNKLYFAMSKARTILKSQQLASCYDVKSL